MTRDEQEIRCEASLPLSPPPFLAAHPCMQLAVRFLLQIEIHNIMKIMRDIQSRPSLDWLDPSVFA